MGVEQKNDIAGAPVARAHVTEEDAPSRHDRQGIGQCRTADRTAGSRDEHPRQHGFAERKRVPVHERKKHQPDIIGSWADVWRGDFLWIPPPNTAFT